MKNNGILIVEDEPIVRFVIADDFEDQGFTVFQAENSDQALELLEQNPDIGVVFTDIRIPGSIDGLGLLGEVGKHGPASP